MDKICVFLKQVLEWANIQGKVNIVFARKASCRIVSMPRPLIEFYLIDWNCQTKVSMLDHSLEVLPGEVFVSNAHVGYNSTCENEYNYWCVSIKINNEPAFSDISGTPLMMKAKIRDFQEVSDFFNQVICEYGREDELNQIKLKTSILRLLVCLIDNISGGKHKKTCPPAIQRALDIIHSEYNKPSLLLPDLAKSVHLSDDHFGRLFREYLNTSPMKYLTKQRVRAACELINRDTTLSIKEIAYQVGFNDALHFSRLFHNYMSMSPSQYRLQISDKISHS